MSSQYDLNSIRDLVVHLETLVQLLYGTESQKGMLAELQESNVSFSERLSSLDDAFKKCRLALEDAAGGHVFAMAELVEQLRESVELLNCSLQHIQPAQFALVVQDRLEQSIGNSIAKQMDERLNALSATISERVNSELAQAAVLSAREAIVVRRQDLVDEVLEAVKEDVRELLAAGEFKSLANEHKRVLEQVKLYRLALISLASITFLSTAFHNWIS